eukprot:g6691.t1
MVAQGRQSAAEIENECEHLERSLQKWTAINAAEGRSKDVLVKKEIEKRNDEIQSARAVLQELDEKHEEECARLTKTSEDKVEEYSARMNEMRQAIEDTVQECQDIDSGGADAMARVVSFQNTRLEEARKDHERIRKELMTALMSQKSRLEEVQQHHTKAEVELEMQKRKQRDAESEHAVLQARLKNLQDEVAVVQAAYDGLCSGSDADHQKAFRSIESSLRLCMTLDDLVRPDLTCKACLSILVKPQLLFPCSHTFCLSCLGSLRRMVGGSQFYVCPECSNKCSIDSVCTNTALNSLCSKYTWWQIPLAGMRNMHKRATTMVAGEPSSTLIEEEDDDG